MRRIFTAQQQQQLLQLHAFPTTSTTTPIFCKAMHCGDASSHGPALTCISLFIYIVRSTKALLPNGRQHSIELAVLYYGSVHL